MNSLLPASLNIFRVMTRSWSSSLFGAGVGALTPRVKVRVRVRDRVRVRVRLRVRVTISSRVAPSGQTIAQTRNHHLAANLCAVYARAHVCVRARALRARECVLARALRARECA